MGSFDVVLQYKIFKFSLWPHVLCKNKLLKQKKYAQFTFNTDHQPWFYDNWIQ